MDGYEFAERLRQLEHAPKVTLIAVTGYADEAHRLRCQQAGFDYYLVKPIDPAYLEGMLKRLDNVPSRPGFWTDPKPTEW